MFLGNKTVVRSTTSRGLRARELTVCRVPQGPEKFNSLGARIPRGASRAHPTVKTLLARSVEGRRRAFSASPALSSWIFRGRRSTRVRDLFERLTQLALHRGRRGYRRGRPPSRRGPRRSHDERERPSTDHGEMAASTLKQRDRFAATTPTSSTALLRRAIRRQVFSIGRLKGAARSYATSRQAALQTVDIEAIARRSLGFSVSSPTSSTRRRSWPRDATRSRSATTSSTRPSTA